MGMSEKNIQDLFDALAGIYSRRFGIEVKAIVKKKDANEMQETKINESASRKEVS
ncbi:hypothetical protein I6N96_09075 [Enterococcus sp. BWM-S5]|uniref:Uncharacterized protein n=1 Tax=Enterococcus larvae TaxID=2794352 RepID=A0ABS4CK89_9ENTE|nr:hypothetical protein [Enterococcus larvae]MBP1046435.1 hypothetical protein [Enterococcus larvae]